MNLPLAFFIFICCLVQLSQQQAGCNLTNNCAKGCCSRTGKYGLSPHNCGDGNQSSCACKAECPDNQWSEGDTCPLNGYFDKHGRCGYTKDFSGEETASRPYCSVNSTAVTRVIGYYEPWGFSKKARRGKSSMRNQCSSMLPEEVPFGYYTHIVFSFATIDPRTFKVTAGNSDTKYIMSRIRSIKLIQPDVQVWVSLGGWAFNDDGPTRMTFSDLAASSDNTTTFLDSLILMMHKNEFDGVDIDWEYPVANDRNGRAEDYKNIVTFMKRVRSRMKDVKKGVSMVIPSRYNYLKGFDIKALEPFVDWFNLMSYDMHGSWDILDESTGPWANSHTNMTEIQMALDLLWRNDISPTKVTMGMSFFSRSFTLADPSCNDAGCRISSGGNPGVCSGTVGVLHHTEIQPIIQENNLEPVLHVADGVKTVSWGNQWVSFDDEETWRLKANIARSQCIDSFMVRSLSHDDENETNAKALRLALERKMMEWPNFDPDSKKKTLLRVPAPQLCRWSSCYEGCPAGFKEVRHEGHKDIMMDSGICRDQHDSLGFARFCCPSSRPLPTCTWRGHNSAGNCHPGCDSDEVEVGSARTGCIKNHLSACCADTKVTKAYGQCSWTDCQDESEPACGENSVVSSSLGWGGHKACKKGESRTLCCTGRPPVEFRTDCKWVPKVDHLKGGGLDHICEGACPQDSIKLSLALGFHDIPGKKTSCYGHSAYCCAEPRPIV